MKRINSLLCAGLFAFVATSGSANADFITFEGVAPPGGSVIPASPYTEGSFTVSSTSPNNGIFSVSGAQNVSGFSSDYYAWDNTQPTPQITIAEVAGSIFSLKSLEIGFGGTGGGPTSDVTLTGFLSGGGSISQNFFGVTAATVVNPVGFTNLTSLDINATIGDAGIDNISVNVVPEPSTAILGLIGLVAMIGRRRR